MKQYQKSPSITNGSRKSKLWQRGLWRRIGKGWVSTANSPVLKQ